MEQTMDMAKFGQFIKQRRNELGMTQKELGEKGGVSDKAVSKWERGLSFPDITLLPALAQALQVTVGELVTSERNEQETVERTDMEKVINKTMEYSKQSYRLKERKNTALTAMTLALTAGVICLIINVAVNSRVSWSLYPIGALVLVAVTTAAASLPRHHKPDFAFLAFFTTLSLYLALIRWLSASGAGLLALGLPLAFAGTTSVYAVVKAVAAIKNQRLRGRQIAFVLLMILFLVAAMASLIVNVATSRRVDWSLYPLGAFLLIAATAATALFAKRNRLHSTFLVLFATLCPYLALIHRLSASPGWLLPLALPIALVSTGSAYLIAIAFARLRNRFYAWAASLVMLAVGPLFLVTAILTLNGIPNSSNYNIIIGAPVLLLAAAILFLLGTRKAPRQ